LISESGSALPFAVILSEAKDLLLTSLRGILFLLYTHYESGLIMRAICLPRTVAAMGNLHHEETLSLAS